LFDYVFNVCYTLGMKNSLTTSDIRDLTNEGTEFGVDNRAINELLNEAQEREEFEALLDSRMDDARAHFDAKWAKVEDADAYFDALVENHLDALGGDRLSD